MNKITVITHATIHSKSCLFQLDCSSRQGNCTYIFGSVHEGAYRAILTNRKFTGKWANIAGIFAVGSARDASVVAGLIGLLNGIASAKKQSKNKSPVRIGGDPGFAAALSTFRDAEFRAEIEIVFGSEENELVNILPIWNTDPVLPADDYASRLVRNMFSDRGLQYDMDRESEFDDQISVQVAKLPNIKLLAYSIEYTTPIKTEFNAQLATSLGVPQGKVIGDLMRGVDYVIPETGAIVTKEQVTQIKGGKRVQIMIFNDCQITELEQVKLKVGLNRVPAVVVHLGQQHRLGAYTKIMSSLDGSIQLYNIEAKYAPSGMVSVYNFNHTLSRSAPAFFVRWNSASSRPAETKQWQLAAQNSSKYPFISGTTIDLDADPDSSHDIFQEIQQEFVHSERRRFTRRRRELPLRDRVTCLGTSSYMPGMYRNVSSTLLQLNNGYDGVLLDCGEDTCAGLLRVFEDNYELVLSQLKAILISHMHLDHVLGMLALLSAWKSTLCKSLIVIGPSQVGRLLDEWGFFEVSFIDANRLLDSAHTISTTLSISSVEATHGLVSTKAFSYIIQSSNPRLAIAYSGDTRPNEILAREAKLACVNLMIHEATFANSDSTMAEKRFHSTAQEAVAIACDSGASGVILTHIASRYSLSIPSYGEIIPDSRIKIMQAYDGLQIELDKSLNRFPDVELQRDIQREIFARFGSNRT
ncbi:beta-lactamase-like protein [Lipomyces oligophaga]|uniref:beta-lactamase-like protein n=1 Tax=Lipomyces oligophaga TaxID=45792 RepID=UPI0034CEE829